MVLVGQVGRQLVNRINAYAPLTCSMSGEDSDWTLSARKSRVIVDGEQIDMGLSGRHR